MIQIMYPPKGRQYRKVFAYNPNGEIVTISDSRIKAMSAEYTKIRNARCQCELERYKDIDSKSKLSADLTDILTRGNQYVTDELIPIMCVGNMTDVPGERQIREALDMNEAFLSARAVFDFDSSVALRKQIEFEKTVFNVKKADDFRSKRTENEFAKSSPVWFYCNGNDELKVQTLEPRQWLDRRFSGVKEAMNECRDVIPSSRAQVIFLVFAEAEEGCDPMLTIARDAFLHTFKDECVVVAENENILRYWKRELSCLISAEDSKYYFHSGLPWKNICDIMRSVFKPGLDVAYKLPSSSGCVVEMTRKEKDEEAYDDIEILSAEQCLQEEDKMSEEEMKNNMNSKEKQFYKGNVVSWWNFYYDQVSERDLYKKLQDEIQHILIEGGRKPVEVLYIQHHPGAGGTTLGRYLLWHFSQLKNRSVKTTYRCCVINNITETSSTADQLERFRNFKDEDPKPFVAFLDNKGEENLHLLLSKLEEIAYKTGKPRSLYCLLIVMNRVPTSISTKTQRRRHTLKHELTSSEKLWFEKKYKELEDKQAEVDTLIAFNVMRKEFEPEYIHELAQGIMKEVSKPELQMLKCLSLISTFDRDQPVPTSVFDSMLSGKRVGTGYLNLSSVLEHAERSIIPMGMVPPMNVRQNMKRRRGTWNVTMTSALSLLITQRKDDLNHNGVCIVAQALAREILKYIMVKEKMTLEQIVLYVLEIVKEHAMEKNDMSKRFVRIVNSLFKTRQSSREGKTKFSDLVLELEQRTENDESTTAQERVIKVMSQCFTVTEDAMVGQQLARFHIHTKDFDAAEKTIRSAIEKRSNSSYLHDTYGQIHRAHMDHMLSMYTDGNKIGDADACRIVNLAIQAIDKFKEGQRFSRDSNDELNLNCFQMEVHTAMTLLENMDGFKCHGGEKDFFSFLNSEDYPVDASTYCTVVANSRLEELRRGHHTQRHMQVSLRKIEERSYQIKNTAHLVQTDTNQGMLLKLRDRFELFFGERGAAQETNFKFSIGLKPLMDARHKHPLHYTLRVQQAQRNIEKSDLRLTKPSDLQDDLLVYLGNEIISMTSDTQGEAVAVYRYEKLLRYSSLLLKTQLKQERPYLEAFIYYALLHWPCETRSTLKELCPLAAYNNTLEEWKLAYERNFEIEMQRKYRKDKPKNFFALGFGELGRELVDLELLKKFWKDDKKQAEGRIRKHVLRDNFWKEPYVEAALERLCGTLDDTGNVITYSATNYHGSYDFRIRTYIPCRHLSNRKVSFVLGFRWNGLTALDVEEAGRVKTRTAQMQEDSRKLLASYIARAETSEGEVEPVDVKNSASDGERSITETETMTTGHTQEKDKMSAALLHEHATRGKNGEETSKSLGAEALGPLKPVNVRTLGTGIGSTDVANKQTPGAQANAPDVGHVDQATDMHTSTGAAANPETLVKGKKSSKLPDYSEGQVMSHKQRRAERKRQKKTEKHR